MEASMKMALPFVCMIAVTQLSYAADPKYSVSANTLTLPTINVGNINYNNLTIKLDKVTVVGNVSSSIVSGPNALPTLCDMTIRQYDKIQLGMTIDQVNQTLGCQYTNKGGLGDDYPSDHNYTTFSWWNGNDAMRAVNVYFDKSAMYVTLNPLSRVETPNVKVFKEPVISMAITFTK